MNSSQERAPSFRCFDNLLNLESWETYRQSPDYISFVFDNESLDGDYEELVTIGGHLDEDEKQANASPSQDLGIDGLEDVIKNLEKARFGPKQKISKPSKIPLRTTNGKLKFNAKEDIPAKVADEQQIIKDIDNPIIEEYAPKKEVVTEEKRVVELKNYWIAEQMMKDNLEESVKKIDEDLLNKNVKPQQESVSSFVAEEISDTSGKGEMEEHNYEDESTEDMADSSSSVLTSKTGLDINKASLFFGLTSGSVLIGFSIGWFSAAKEDQCWLTSAVSNVVARKVWESMGTVIMTGLVGTSLLGFSSYKFWFKEEK